MKFLLPTLFYLYNCRLPCDDISSAPSFKEVVESFTDEDLLGVGGEGKVYMKRVKDPTSRRSYSAAIKETKIKNRKDTEREIFIETALSNLDVGRKQGISTTRWIPKFLHCYQRGDTVYVVTEALEQNLYAARQKYLNLFLTDLFDLYLEIVAPVVFIQSQYIVHCDVKPENLLRTKSVSPRVKMIDFGTCRDATKDYCEGGTLGYMPPEGRDPKTPPEDRQKYVYANDVYSLGIILADSNDENCPCSAKNEELQESGKLRFSNAAVVDIAKTNLKERIAKSESKTEVSIMSKLRDLVLRMLSFRPADRPSVTQVFYTLATLYQLSSKYEQNLKEIDSFEATFQTTFNKLQNFGVNTAARLDKFIDKLYDGEEFLNI